MTSRRYNEAIGRHFWQPIRPRGQLFSGMAGSVEQGTVIDFSVGLSDKKMCDVGFRAYACPHIIAACSLMADHLDGQPAERLTDPGLPDVLKELEIPVEKAGKILILQDALRACYDQLGSLAGAQAD
jgi:NifU-like protein involved in Fe-S cluster formation